MTRTLYVNVVSSTGSKDGVGTESAHGDSWADYTGGLEDTSRLRALE